MLYSDFLLQTPGGGFARASTAKFLISIGHVIQDGNLEITHSGNAGDAVADWLY